MKLLHREAVYIHREAVYMYRGTVLIKNNLLTKNEYNI